MRNLIGFIIGAAIAATAATADARSNHRHMIRSHWNGNIKHSCLAKWDGPHCWLTDYRHGNARVEGEVFDTAVTPNAPHP
jgi:hypothetical protein